MACRADGRQEEEEGQARRLLRLHREPHRGRLPRVALAVAVAGASMRINHGCNR